VLNSSEETLIISS